MQGASSAGKSTLARALQKGLDEHWWALEADHITDTQATSGRNGWWNPSPEERPHPSWAHEARLAQWLKGYWGCLRRIALSGSDVIAVGGWLEKAWLEQFSEAMDGIPALCVAVRCPIEELERREEARGDRESGYAASQLAKVFAQGPLDVEVGSYGQSMEEVVGTIRATLASPPSPTFLDRVRRGETG